MSVETAEDVFDLLDDAPVASDEMPDSGPPAAPPSPHVVKLDEWCVNKGESLTGAEWNAEAKIEAPVLADAYGACFEFEPQLEDNPADKVRGRWFEDLLGSADFRALRETTCLDVNYAELATVDVSKRYIQYAKELQPGDQEAIQNGEQESVKSEMGRMRSITQTVQAASETVQECKDACDGLGGGGSDSSSPLDAKKLSELFKKVRENKTLRSICNLAGRYRRLAKSLQNAKPVHGMDDMVDVRPGGDVSRLVPTELMALVSPELELMALQRLAERQSMSRHYESKQTVAKGPIVVVVDESGSMGGQKIENAKALALALGWVARHQKRWIAFVGFSGGTEGTRIAFPPGKWDQSALIEWLTHFYSGGTDLDVPLEQLPNVYWNELRCPPGKTDVVFITDAIVHCPDKMRDNFLAWKKAHTVKTFGIILSYEPGDMSKVCDRTWCIRELNLDCEAVEGVLSL